MSYYQCIFSVIVALLSFYRDTISGQLQLAIAKVESEHLARSLADKQRSDIEKDKTMIELELRESLKVHEANVIKKELKITAVSVVVQSNPFII